MNEFDYVMKTFSEFSEKMSQAGFTDGAFRQFVRAMPSVRFGRADEGLLRKLYLAYIGLAEFTLKPTAVDMYGEGHYSEEESTKFYESEWADFKIHDEDMGYFDRKIDVTCLDVMSPLFQGERKITLEEGLRRVVETDTTIKFASFWHASWLFHHKEFIPEEWYKVVKNGGRIIFPRVRLTGTSHESSIAPNEPRVRYPSFEPDHGGFNIEFKQSMQINYGGPQYMEHLRKGKDFFAFFSSVKKEEVK